MEGVAPRIVEDLRLRFGIDAAFPVQESGWFLPTWRSDRGRCEDPAADLVPGQEGIPTGALHLLKCDEIYTFVDGDPVELCLIAPNGRERVVTLHRSGGVSHGVVQGQTVHAVKSMGGSAGYSDLHLVTVPGLVDEDASIPPREQLQARFPEHADLIARFTLPAVPASPPAGHVTPRLEPAGEAVGTAPVSPIGGEIGAAGAGDSRRRECHQTYPFSHDVYFKLADGTSDTRERFAEYCYSYLSRHEGLVEFSLGFRAREMQRQANDQEFDIVTHMLFENRRRYEEYCQHPDHKKWIMFAGNMSTSRRVCDAYLVPENSRDGSKPRHSLRQDSDS